MVIRSFKSLTAMVLAGCFYWSSLAAAVKEIAITIDDLPFVGSTYSKPGNLQREHDRFYNLMQALIDYKVPAIGFVIAGSIEKGQWQLLEAFKAQGFLLGNHTYSHKSLGAMSADKYILDIDKADKILNPLLISGPKYFRYPYLAESKGAKKEAVYQYLAQHDYIVAPVTIDSKDYEFNARYLNISWRVREQQLPAFKKRYLDYIWRQTLRAEARAAKTGNGDSRQILLIHANLLNSYCLGDIIAMFEQNGYKIVSLTDILDSSPSLAPSTPPVSQMESVSGLFH